MHRRGVGAGAIAKKKLAEAKYKERGTVLAEDQLAQMSKQLDMFKTNLEEFASKHKQEIRKNPEFRVQFQDMCATIGVDPLASGKGFWSEMLGVGDFYYELGVQIIEVCLALKHRNGGLITLEELHQQVLKGRGKFAQDVSQKQQRASSGSPKAQRTVVLSWGQLVPCKSSSLAASLLKLSGLPGCKEGTDAHHYRSRQDTTHHDH
uniref:Vacuolar-sorting protein SNF8 n=1 Tax=Strigops habroptila TaxID=2489341 RepID=A0A672UQ94_STRHB